ncbi:MAG: alpha/beta fold hydrolase [Caldilineales bacterium]|nr:alpha/beta fold hydrolase [Caldilineales bacterium]MDW8318624.1 alpha/beta fold hydrolase [Anaerolineae bacterium]
MPHLDVHGRRLSWTRSGHGPQTVLFVHGGFATQRWWEPVANLLPAELYTAYRFDLPGHGESDPPADPDGYAVERLAATLAELVNGLGLDGLHLVGHSLGAAVALTYALAEPDRLRSLVLVSTPSVDGTPTPPEAMALLEQMRHDRPLLLQALASTMPARAPDALVQQLVDDALSQAPAAFTATAQALADWRLPLPALARLRLPVLLVCGDRDHIVERRVQERLLLSIPGANNLEVFQGCGHTPLLERTEGFVAALRDFFEQDFEAYAAIRAAATAEP